jgi:hypothetical protein
VVTVVKLLSVDGSLVELLVLLRIDVVEVVLMAMLAFGIADMVSVVEPRLVGPDVVA